RLGHFEAQLNEKLFFRCHHSHLVNLRHILKVSKGKSGYITLPNQEQVPVSQSRKEQLHGLLRL
ncbi:MAG: LytTR family DNA-binding domain-containing protein, partial [Bacteroidota bacterium]